MERSRAERIDDVRRLCEAARSVVTRREEIAPAIVESTGLSPAGVELALTRHLEVDATDAEIGALVTRAGDAPAAFVILSANVFVGALRAIALARAAAPRVVVRPSRRDPAFARALVFAANDPQIVLDEDLDVATITEGEIHVYGRDETISDVRARARVRVRGHGSGMGIAWISKRANLEDAAAALADDVVVFDQRGCLSPRIALVEVDPGVEDAVDAREGDGRAASLAEALHRSLEQRSEAVPRGQLPSDERAASDRYIATMTYACRALVGREHAIGVAPPGAPLVLPPPYRHVHVAPCASAEAARALLAPLSRAIVAASAIDEDDARAIAPPWARLCPLGRMQRPPLDGPVDLREDWG